MPARGELRADPEGHLSASALVPPLIILSAVALYLAWCFTRARELLDGWAARSGFTLVRARRRVLFSGPFTWTSSRSQFVYLVEVRDQDGRERHGWVRCGSFLAGVHSDAVEVRWKDEAP